MRHFLDTQFGVLCTNTSVPIPVYQYCTNTSVPILYQYQYQSHRCTNRKQIFISSLRTCAHAHQCTNNSVPIPVFTGTNTCVPEHCIPEHCTNASTSLTSVPISVYQYQCTYAHTSVPISAPVYQYHWNNTSVPILYQRQYRCHQCTSLSVPIPMHLCPQEERVVSYELFPPKSGGS